MDKYANTSGGTIPIVLTKLTKAEKSKPEIYYFSQPLAQAGLGELHFTRYN
jgi:3-oxoacyl-[acyl-carrier-protein] synthase III